MGKTNPTSTAPMPPYPSRRLLEPGEDPAAAVAAPAKAVAEIAVVAGAGAVVDRVVVAVETAPDPVTVDTADRII